MIEETCAQTACARLAVDATGTLERGHPTAIHFNGWLGLVLPTAVLTALALVLTGEWDMRIASWIYSSGGNEWIYKNGFWTERIIHKAGRLMTGLGALSVLILIALSYLRPLLTRWRGLAIRLLVALVISTALVSILKRYSGLDCPWSIVGLGGTHLYITLFDSRMLAGGCFPAGHASSGYAWLALYFFFAEVAPRYRWMGLALGADIGLVFGIGQQLRGAHFLSHDVATVLICWVVSAGLFVLRTQWLRAGRIGPALLPRRA